MIQDRFQVALVTGASSGIGAEMARQLASQGVAVGLIARRLDHLEALAREISNAGGRAAAAQADVSSRAQVLSACSYLETQLGPTDLLIANAGVGLSSNGQALDVAGFEQMVAVNLLGPIYTIEATLPGMLDRGSGHLVGISSLASYRGLPGSAGYCATKSGLSTFLESLRVDLAPRGITVTTVHPGYVATPMTANARHPKPFEIDADTAARIILRAVRSQKATVNFPWQMAALMSLIRRLPTAIYDRLARRLGAEAKPTTGPQ